MTDYAMPGLDFAKVLAGSRVGRETKRRARQLEEAERPRRKKGRKGRRGSLGRVKKTVSAAEAREYRRLSAEEQVRSGIGIAKGAGRIAGVLASEKGREFLKAARAVPLSGGVVAVAIAAGLAAYGITSYLISRKKAQKEGREQLAHDAAQAYRYARVTAAEKLGRELTAPEQRMLAADFKAELAKLGLTTTKLF